MKLACIRCGVEVSHETYGKSGKALCHLCGGLADFAYDYGKVKDCFPKPSEGPDHMWRYGAVLPVEARFAPPLYPGLTPLLESDRLAALVGVRRVFVKNDGMNPTGSLKDRASAVAVASAAKAGAPAIACSSTGNAASSLSGMAAAAGIPAVIFVPRTAPRAKVNQSRAYGAIVLVIDGDYTKAFEASAWAIDHYGFYNRNAAINPVMLEGKKTVSFEISEQLDHRPTDWVVVSVGDGCTVAGVCKGFLELKQMGIIEHVPKVLGVQAEAASPIHDMFSGMPGQRAYGDTLAESISVSVPRNPDKAVLGISRTKGGMITVSDAEIVEAILELGRTTGVYAEPAAAASLAGLHKAISKGMIAQHETVTLIVTGHGLKDPVSVIPVEGELVRPESAAIEAFIDARMGV